MLSLLLFADLWVLPFLYPTQPAHHGDGAISVFVQAVCLEGGQEIVQSLQKASCTTRFSESEDGQWHTKAGLTAPANLELNRAIATAKSARVLA